MKNIFFSLFILLSLQSFAQTPCVLETNTKDSLGVYKATKQSMVFERSFAGKSTHIFFTLVSINGVITLETQLLQRSNEFIKANCFDANSKIYLQLNDGKIIPLFYTGKETCGSYIHGENDMNNRVLGGTFVFAKENYDDLKTSPVTFMQLKFAGETIDYPFKTELVSELDKNKYEPENYFVTFLKCFEN